MTYFCPNLVHRVIDYKERFKLNHDYLTLHNCSPGDNSSNGCLAKQREHANEGVDVELLIFISHNKLFEKSLIKNNSLKVQICNA